MKTLMVLACALVACSSSPLEGGTAFVDSCPQARLQLLGAVDTVSTGSVQVLADTSGVKTLYVDATAGGPDAAFMRPWTFVALGNAAKVQVSDVTSLQSLAWDLAFKRAIIYSNGGQGGPGKAGSVYLDKDFAEVTSADLSGADFVSERFFDDDCTAIVDLTGAASTSFSAWYDYDAMSHLLSPTAGTWLVRSAAGKVFKLRFQSYYGTPSGGMGTEGGAYLLEIAAL